MDKQLRGILIGSCALGFIGLDQYFGIRKSNLFSAVLRLLIKLRYTVYDKCKLRYAVNDCSLNHNRIICRNVMNVMIACLGHKNGVLTTFLLHQAEIRLV